VTWGRASSGDRRESVLLSPGGSHTVVMPAGGADACVRIIQKSGSARGAPEGAGTAIRHAECPGEWPRLRAMSGHSDGTRICTTASGRCGCTVMAARQSRLLPARPSSAGRTNGAARGRHGRGDERQYANSGAPKPKTCGRPAHCPPGFCAPYSSEKVAECDWHLGRRAVYRRIPGAVDGSLHHRRPTTDVRTSSTETPRATRGAGQQARCRSKEVDTRRQAVLVTLSPRST